MFSSLFHVHKKPAPQKTSGSRINPLNRSGQHVKTDEDIDVQILKGTP